jgi:hypothetical protein
MYAPSTALDPRGDRPMKYMLMMHPPRGTGDWQILQWTPEKLQAHMDFMHNLNKDLKASGELVGAEGLASPGEAKLVRAGKSGEPITDGPFAESKEFLAGFWIIDVEGNDRAYQVAAKASTAPGPDGTPLNMPIEVRPIMHDKIMDV